MTTDERLIEAMDTGPRQEEEIALDGKPTGLVWIGGMSLSKASADIFVRGHFAGMWKARKILKEEGD